MEPHEIECTHCGRVMSQHQGSGQTVKYYRCSGCHRWVSSHYSDVFKVDAKVRRNPIKEPETTARFDEVKDRLERWLTALEDQDPYRLLGVSPGDTLDQIRARYRELALIRHPDRGGTVDSMRELNVAYERITQHRERRKQEALPATVAQHSLRR